MRLAEAILICTELLATQGVLLTEIPAKIHFLIEAPPLRKENLQICSFFFCYWHNSKDIGEKSSIFAAISQKQPISFEKDA
ncbi:hypothetical protein M3201_18115 [Paenibacillus motobuensis]|uniref:hypothetical protein n=1 Tax=Paenibacillus TaxID=44249 RepID=UPI00203B9D8C|nr:MULTISPECIES: hypothetical protein [Paenibacillus]MCM3041614.1 hypothetical protein [Paenibacillus lutimineralis]MCM3648718.1 hypothetical protein [Paenibacillus motobuensis]